MKLIPTYYLLCSLNFSVKILGLSAPFESCRVNILILGFKRPIWVPRYDIW